MPSFGPLLRRTREDRGVSIDDIARETRLSKRYLTALEEEAIAKLPGGTYNRAYLRTYATFLGLDPERLLRDYASMEEGQSSPVEEDLLITMNRAIEQRAQTPPADGSDVAGWSRMTGLFGVPNSIVLVIVAAAVIGGAAWYAKFATTGTARSRTPVSLRVVSAAPERKAAPSAPPPAGVNTPAVTPPAIQVPTGRPDQRLRNPPPRQTAPAPVPDPAPASAPPPQVVAPDTIARPQAAGALSPLAIPSSRPPSASTLAVTGSGVGTAVVDRQLVGKADRFAPGSQVVFWTHIVGGRNGDTIDHVWFRDGSPVGASSLSVGSSDWRTQSRRVLEPPGEWAVEARDADGRVLARHEFHSGDQ